MFLRLNRVTLVSIVLTVLPHIVLALDCETRRLDQPGSAFDKIPVYNQLDVRGVDGNICYAIASSQLIDEYRFRKGDSLKESSSPLSLAIGYKEYSQDSINKTYNTEPISSQNIFDSILGGGFIEETLASVGRIEICDQNSIEKDAGLMHPDSFTKSDTQSAQQFVENILLTPTSSKIKSFFKIDHLSAVKNALQNKCQGHLFSVGEVRFESLNSGNYLDDLLKLTEKQMDPSMSTEEKLKLRIEFSQKYDKTKIVQKYENQIDSLLKQGIPVGVSYLMKVLQKKSGTTEFAAHASIIIGQRENPISHTCELLVRDSYGANCQDSRGNDRYSLPCENGSVWVEADALLRQTSKINWIP
ncbi:MAG TPA: hypothetical protein VN132_01855 [Bdellovibrio sp.]|nr:hypothetical protein [Bdellovibrio sp.]